jgi:hypothetical protein
MAGEGFLRAQLDFLKFRHLRKSFLRASVVKREAVSSISERRGTVKSVRAKRLKAKG